jgi:hypothetical protein
MPELSNLGVFEFFPSSSDFTFGEFANDMISDALEDEHYSIGIFSDKGVNITCRIEEAYAVEEVDGKRQKSWKVDIKQYPLDYKRSCSAHDVFIVDMEMATQKFMLDTIVPILAINVNVRIYLFYPNQMPDKPPQFLFAKLRTGERDHIKYLKVITKPNMLLENEHVTFAYFGKDIKVDPAIISASLNKMQEFVISDPEHDKFGCNNDIAVVKYAFRVSEQQYIRDTRANMLTILGPGVVGQNFMHWTPHVTTKRQVEDMPPRFRVVGVESDKGTYKFMFQSYGIMLSHFNVPDEVKKTEE